MDGDAVGTAIANALTALSPEEKFDVIIIWKTVLAELAAAHNADAINGVGNIFQDEGVSLPQRTKVTFNGTGVTGSDDAENDRTVYTISAEGLPGTEITDVFTASAGQLKFTLSNLPISIHRVEMNGLPIYTPTDWTLTDQDIDLVSEWSVISAGSKIAVNYFY